MTNELYIAPESRNVWAASGGDDALDLVGVASGEMSEIGSYWEPDQSSVPTGAWSGWYEWEFELVDHAPNGTGYTLELWWTSCSETPGTVTNWDGCPATAPTDTVAGAMPAVTTGTAITLLNNLWFAGHVTTIDTTRTWKRSGQIFLPGRYLAPIIYNGAFDPVSNQPHTVSLRPIPHRFIT